MAESADEGLRLSTLKRPRTSKKKRLAKESASVSSPSTASTEENKKRTAKLLDLDVMDCPICYDTLTIPIFQCDNGHVACSACCGKLRQKCATCSLPTLSRNRALERVLEVLIAPCPNAKFGCSETISCDERLTHLEDCAFTQRPCPFSRCDFTSAYKDLYAHVVAKHCKSSDLFDCGELKFVYPLNGERVILKERTTEGEKEGELVVVECFNTPQGRIFYASCIGPGTEVFSYSLKLYSSSGDRLVFESHLERVSEVSDEAPVRRFMFVPSYMFPDYKFHICINNV